MGEVKIEIPNLPAPVDAPRNNVQRVNQADKGSVDDVSIENLPSPEASLELLQPNTPTDIPEGTVDIVEVPIEDPELPAPLTAALTEDPEPTHP